MQHDVVTNFLVSNTHIWSCKTENITSEMRFVLIFKFDVPRALPTKCHYDTIIRRL